MNFKKRVNGSWADTPHYIHKADTDILTTLPDVVYVNDTTATVGLKGQMKQSSTPTPDNPVMPEGTGDRTRNLFDKSQPTTLPNKYLLSNGEESSSASGWAASAYIPVSGDYVTLTGVGGNRPSICAYDSNKQFVRGMNYGNNNRTTINISDCSFVRFSYVPTVQGDNAMLSLGSTPLPYEPYGYKIPISSAGQTTPIYLGEVQATRKIKKLVLTGEEANWYYYENATGTVKFFYFVIVRVVGINLTGLPNTHGYSTHEVTQQSGNTIIRIYAVSEGMETIEEWKSYLRQQYVAGTPVTVWYVLAEPTTGIVNEPLMKIGDYADEVSGISIPTIAGANMLSVDTTVQPSGVAINYKGWHNTKCKEYNYNMTIADWESASISQMENHTIQELQGGNWV